MLFNNIKHNNWCGEAFVGRCLFTIYGRSLGCKCNSFLAQESLKDRDVYALQFLWKMREREGAGEQSTVNHNYNVRENRN